MFLFREHELFLLEYLLCTYLVLLFILKKEAKKYKSNKFSTKSTKNFRAKKLNKTQVLFIHF